MHVDRARCVVQAVCAVGARRAGGGSAGLPRYSVLYDPRMWMLDVISTNAGTDAGAYGEGDAGVRSGRLSVLVSADVR